MPTILMLKFHTKVWEDMIQKSLSLPRPRGGPSRTKNVLRHQKGVCVCVCVINFTELMCVCVRPWFESASNVLSMFLSFMRVCCFFSHHVYDVSWIQIFELHIIFFVSLNSLYSTVCVRVWARKPRNVFYESHTHQEVKYDENPCPAMMVIVFFYILPIFAGNSSICTSIAKV